MRLQNYTYIYTRVYFVQERYLTKFIKSRICWWVIQVRENLLYLSSELVNKEDATIIIFAYRKIFFLTWLAIDNLCYAKARIVNCKAQDEVDMEFNSYPRFHEIHSSRLPSLHWKGTNVFTAESSGKGKPMVCYTLSYIYII